MILKTLHVESYGWRQHTPIRVGPLLEEYQGNPVRYSHPLPYGCVWNVTL